jgi:hypothetical protein
MMRMDDATNNVQATTTIFRPQATGAKIATSGRETGTVEAASPGAGASRRVVQTELDPRRKEKAPGDGPGALMRFDPAGRAISGRG